MKETNPDLKPLLEGERIVGVVVKVFAATCNEDRTEGRGKTIDHSYHLTEREARIGAAGLGWGLTPSDGGVAPRLTIKTDQGRYFLVPEPIEIASDPETEAKLRQQALDKLSPAEIAALLGRKE